MMFKQGDAVLHPQHGAGIITAVETCEVAGVERTYYYIELINDSGMLMMPIEQADESGLRPTKSRPDAILAVLSRNPEELASDYRKRHSNIEAKVHSGDPKLVAQALRDLAWRKAVDKLSMRDEQLKEKAQTLLASIFALQDDLDIDSASRHVSALVSQSIKEHVATAAPK